MMIIMITIMLIIITIFGYLNIHTHSTIEKFTPPREEEEGD
jgi:predicted RND superfamily exporter protein